MSGKNKFVKGDWDHRQYLKKGTMKRGGDRCMSGLRVISVSWARGGLERRGPQVKKARWLKWPTAGSNAELTPKRPNKTKKKGCTKGKKKY